MPGALPLQRLYEITRDILQAEEIVPALDSIARGLAELYGFRYVSIVASDTPGGELYRRVLFGFPPAAQKARLDEHIPRQEILRVLTTEFEVVPNCYYIPAERAPGWKYAIPTTEGVRAERGDAGLWHEHDGLTLVLTDRAGDMLGYISLDGPLDGRVPSDATLRDMQVFVNLVGLALAHARARAVEVERRKLLEETSQAQGEFFTVVAHEVRSPLAAIRGATVLLDAHFDSLSAERRRELLTVLVSSTSRLSTIFEDCLLLSRMDAGKLSLRLTAVDAARVVDESVVRMKSEHPERDFQTAFPKAVRRIYADEGRVVQILTNLLSNAAKYSAPGSPIVAAVKDFGDGVRFTVTNRGPGVPVGERDKLFTRFGRLSRNSDSVGLGLYICSQLVAAMSGSIGYESRPGEQTSFWFTLPSAN